MELDYEYLAELEDAHDEEMHQQLYVEKKIEEEKRANKVRR